MEIFIVILVAAKVGGITGMVLAIPAYTVLRVIAKAFLSEYKIVKKITEEMEPLYGISNSEDDIHDQNKSEDIASRF